MVSKKIVIPIIVCFTLPTDIPSETLDNYLPTDIQLETLDKHLPIWVAYQQNKAIEKYRRVR